MTSPRAPRSGVLAAFVVLASCRPESHAVPSQASEDARAGTILASAPELELVAEGKLSKLLSADGVAHYGASGVTASGGTLYVAFDNLTNVAAVGTSLDQGTFGPGDFTESQYEGITATDDGRFYAVVETASAIDTRAALVGLDGTTAVVNSVFTDTAFEHYNQGFEGVAWVRVQGIEYVLALCQNNDCNDEDTEPGKGRVQVLSLVDGVWTTQTVLKVPKQAAFVSYSDLALRPNGDGTYVAAIVSRLSSAMWLGTLTTAPWALTGPSSLYTFPKTGDGRIQYCTVEGVTFLGPTVLGFVSDESDGTVPCGDKDESIHVFTLP